MAKWWWNTWMIQVLGTLVYGKVKKSKIQKDIKWVLKPDCDSSQGVPLLTVLSWGISLPGARSQQ